MTSVPVHIGELFNVAHAQCLAVARSVVDGRKRRENGNVDVKLWPRFQ